MTRTNASIGLAFVLAFLSSGTATAWSQPASQPETGHDCLVEAETTIDVGAAVSGLIADILVDRGDAVAAGDVLFKLDARLEMADFEIARARAANASLVAAASAQYEAARANADRMSRLREQNPAALNEGQLADALAAATVAENNLRNAEQDLAIARLEAERARALVETRTTAKPCARLNSDMVGSFARDNDIPTMAHCDAGSRSQPHHQSKRPLPSSRHSSGPRPSRQSQPYGTPSVISSTHSNRPMRKLLPRRRIWRNLNSSRLSYALSGLSAKNEPLHAMSRWRAVAVAGS